MAIYEGDCSSCGRKNVTVFDDTNECTICHRISILEGKIKKCSRLNIPTKGIAPCLQDKK